MKRVDYLFCRIKQLQFKGASHWWANLLARIEQGEKPVRQVYTKAPRPSSIVAAQLALEFRAYKN